MSFEKEFLEFMRDTITVFTKGPKDRYGAYTFPDYPSGGVEYRCRVSGKAVSLRRPSAEDSSSIVDIWIGMRVDGEPLVTTPITVLDKVLLPAGSAWVDREPVVFAVGYYQDPDGMHNCKVQCGWMYHRQGQ